MGCAQDRSPAVQTVAVTPRRLATVLALALVAVVAPACRHDGRSLAPVQAGQTTTTSTEPASTVPTVFTLSSPDVQNGSVLPATYTCQGAGTSPALTWAAAPEAAELALVVRDENANGYVHWIVTGISPTLGSFPEGGIPNGAAEQVNSQGALGYQPPCPPKGSGRHVYAFVLHALATKLTVDPATPASDVAKEIEQRSTAQAGFSVAVAG
jgi:Raf kinase inhibitor-like YbhB/YbcL family protein